MKSHWRRTLVIAPLLAVALLVCVSGSAWAANVVRVEIYSPTESSPVKWVRPGSIVTVTTWVTVDETASVTVGANVGNSDWYSVTRLVTVPSSAREFSVSVPLPERIADGSNNVRVMARTDPSGGVKEASESDAVYVDGTAPVVTLGALPTTPTTNPRPTWTWSGVDALSGLDYYIVTLDGELPFQTTGTSFTPSSDLVHGAHVLKVKAVDKAGNVGTEQSFAAVTIDTAVPAAPAIKPILKGYNTSPLTLKWNAITDGNNTITYVLQWAKDAGFSEAHDETIGSTEGTQYVFDFTEEGKGEDAYWFRVKTISTVNGDTDPKQTKESGWSAVVSTIYDATAPAAPVITLVTPSPTNEPLQQWSWTRTAPDIVRFQFGESADGATTPTSYLLDGDVDNAVTNFTTDGTHHVMVRAIDAAGNVGAWSEAASVVVDLTPPGAPTGLTTTSARIKAPQATWTWTTALDAASYEVELDGGAPVNVGYVGTYTATNLGEGIHTLRVRALDGLGNEGPWSDAVNVEVDWTAPGPPPAPETTSPTASTSQAWVWDALSDKDPFTYEVSMNGGVAVPNGPSNTCTTDLADGEHFLQVRTRDDLGNVSAWSEKGWVIVDTIAPAAPVITLVTPSPTNEPLQQWSWTRTAPDIVRFQFGESPNGATTPTSYLLDGDVDNAVTNFTTDGAHYVMVRAIDAVGNVGAWSAAASVIVDLTPPGKPKNLRVQTPTRNNTPEWTWDAADNPDGDLAGYELLLDDVVAIDVGNVLSYTHSEMLSDGVHTMRARSYDSLGNSSAWTDPATSVLVDATPPETPGMPRTESPTANRRPTWTWNATSGAVTYRVFLDGVAQPANQPSGTPQPGTTFTPAADLADGWHDLQVTAIDALGNESAKSAAGSVLIDGTAPAAPDIAHLPTHTKATQVVFRWSSIGDVAGYNFSYVVGDGEEWTTIEGITTQSYVVKGLDGRDLRDGEVVRGKVQAYDSLENTSEWSGVESTIIDLAGPTVRIIAPDGAKNTNLSTFTWTWTGDDGERGSGVQGYWVKLNDEAWSWTTETVFTSSRLQRGANILRVKGVDSAGNESAATVADAVTLVDAVVFDIRPEPGAHAINEVSTIAFSVAGLYDGHVEALLGDKPIEDGWRLVTVVRTPELAKFYVLLDADIMQPGMLIVTIRVGDSMISCAYRVLSERSGFGFGRLRPW